MILAVSMECVSSVVRKRTRCSDLPLILDGCARRQAILGIFCLNAFDKRPPPRIHLFFFCFVNFAMSLTLKHSCVSESTTISTDRTARYRLKLYHLSLFKYRAGCILCATDAIPDCHSDLVETPAASRSFSHPGSRVEADGSWTIRPR